MICFWNVEWKFQPASPEGEATYQQCEATWCSRQAGSRAACIAICVMKKELNISTCSSACRGSCRGIWGARWSTLGSPSSSPLASGPSPLWCPPSSYLAQLARQSACCPPLAQPWIRKFQWKANREGWHLLAIVVVVYVVADLRVSYNRLWKSWCARLKRIKSWNETFFFSS